MKNKLAAKIIGNIPRNADNHTQLKKEPNIAVNRIPVHINIWKNDPNAPRIEASAISPIYIGAQTHIAPAARPARNLATYSIKGPLANTIRIQFNMNGMANEIRVFFLPNLSARYPAGKAEIKAPKASIDPTIPS